MTLMFAINQKPVFGGGLHNRTINLKGPYPANQPHNKANERRWTAHHLGLFMASWRWLVSICCLCGMCQLCEKYQRCLYSWPASSELRASDEYKNRLHCTKHTNDRSKKKKQFEAGTKGIRSFLRVNLFSFFSSNYKVSLRISVTYRMQSASERMKKNWQNEKPYAESAMAGCSQVSGPFFSLIWTHFYLSPSWEILCLFWVIWRDGANVCGGWQGPS